MEILALILFILFVIVPLIAWYNPKVTVVYTATKRRFYLYYNMFDGNYYIGRGYKFLFEL